MIPSSRQDNPAQLFRAALAAEAPLQIVGTINANHALLARRAGYHLMRLDTLERLHEAMTLYASLGFKVRDPYYPNPLAGVVYWEKDLRNGKHDS